MKTQKNLFLSFSLSLFLSFSLLLLLLIMIESENVTFPEAFPESFDFVGAAAEAAKVAGEKLTESEGDKSSTSDNLNGDTDDDDDDEGLFLPPVPQHLVDQYMERRNIKIEKEQTTATFTPSSSSSSSSLTPSSTSQVEEGISRDEQEKSESQAYIRKLERRVQTVRAEWPELPFTLDQLGIDVESESTPFNEDLIEHVGLLSGAVVDDARDYYTALPVYDPHGSSSESSPDDFGPSSSLQQFDEEASDRTTGFYYQQLDGWKDSSQEEELGSFEGWEKAEDEVEADSGRRAFSLTNQP